MPRSYRVGLQQRAYSPQSGRNMSALSFQRRLRRQTISARPSHLASAASSSEIASMASRGACGSRCTAWTSKRPAWRSALRSTRRRAVRLAGTGERNSRAAASRPAYKSRCGSGSRTGVRSSPAPRRADRRARAAPGRRSGEGSEPRGGERRPASREHRPGRVRPLRPGSAIACSRVVLGESEIVAQFAGRGDSERPGGALDERAMRLGLVGVGSARISAGMTRSVRS